MLADQTISLMMDCTAVVGIAVCFYNYLQMGMTPQGMTPQGMVPQGMTPQMQQQMMMGQQPMYAMQQVCTFVMII